MKKEYFNIDNYGEIYNNIDYLNPNDLKNINGDNIFLAFIKLTLFNSLFSVYPQLYKILMKVSTNNFLSSFV